jgi:hypothetical protein
MMQNITKKYFIGRTLKSGKWSSVYTYKPQNPQILRDRGQIFATISLESHEDFSITTAGNLILDFFHEAYFDNSEDLPFVALEKAIISTSKYLQMLIQNEKSASFGIDMDLLGVICIADIVYVVNLGKSSLFLYRDGRITEISSHLKDPTGEGIIKIGSMLSKKGDVFTLATKSLVDEITEDDFIDMSIDFSEIKLKQREYENESQISMLMIGFNVDRKEASAEHNWLNDQLESQDKVEINTNQGIDTGEIKSLDSNELVYAQDKEIDEEVILEKDIDTADEVSQDNDINKEPNDELSNFDVDDDQEIDQIDNKPKSNMSIKLVNIKEKILGIVFALKQKFIKNNLSSELNSEDISEQKTYVVIVNKIIINIKKIFIKAKDFFLYKILKLEKSGVYVRGKDHKRKPNYRVIIFTIVIALIILIFGIRTISNATAQREQTKIAKQNLEIANNLISEVDSAAVMRAKENNTPVKLELYRKLDEAEEKINLVKQTGVFEEEITERIEKIINLRNILDRAIPVIDPKLIFDFGNAFPGANITDFTSNGKEIFLTDSQYGKVYKININGSNPEEFINGLVRPRNIVIDDKGDLIVLDESPDDKRLLTVNQNDKSIVRHSGTSEFRVGGVSKMQFTNVSNGRIYALDNTNKSVIFLQRTGDSYGIPAERLRMDEIAEAKDLFIIDLKIYLLLKKHDGLYIHFGDNDDTPSLTGLKQGDSFLDATAIYVDGLYTYIADPINSRILVFNKGQSEMSMKAQFVFQGNTSNAFKDIRKIYADINANRLLVLDGTKIYEIDLSRLRQM